METRVLQKIQHVQKKRYLGRCKALGRKVK